MSRIYISIALRQAVIERAGGRCEYCQSPALYSPEIFEVEHIQPLSAGGVTEFANLALACPACNRYKGNLQMVSDLETGQSVTLFNPRIDRWLEHFTWSDDFVAMVGLTPTGRATIATLHVNRLAAQRFRAALHAIGLHPVQL